MYHRSEIWLKRVFVLVPALVLLFGFLPVVPAAAAFDYLEITENTILGANHDGQIEIAADNITLDCDGHSVTWTGEQVWFGIGMLEERSGVTVKNCDVSGDYGFGIISFFGSDHTVLNNVVHGNGKGIAFHQSHDNEAIGNQVYENDEYGLGT
jgi:parallel beta-helix repeat protein